MEKPKDGIITLIAFTAYMGSIFLIYYISNSFIVTIILSCVLFIIITPVTASILAKSERCPFLNDQRLFLSQSVNPNIWYENDLFCSVEDPLNSSYEIVDGMKRRVSHTNQFYSCCINKGENCPIFQKFDKLSKEELRMHYRDKWYLQHNFYE